MPTSQVVITRAQKTTANVSVRTMAAAQVRHVRVRRPNRYVSFTAFHGCVQMEQLGRDGLRVRWKSSVSVDVDPALEQARSPSGQLTHDVGDAASAQRAAKHTATGTTDRALVSGSVTGA
ncbi:hypothetical protein HPB50_021964 [Hyalomma asiaticum]|uniref:Uncharacterized protein n=1 Tax=Hyalomma asiaticum TaxID=266040 RepID=A0ACB7TP03_HYAAI|nr:hypothetical protein HPB50_021964 [Hyalomma asiaticum]